MTLSLLEGTVGHHLKGFCLIRAVRRLQMISELDVVGQVVVLGHDKNGEATAVLENHVEEHRVGVGFVVEVATDLAETCLLIGDDGVPSLGCRNCSFSHRASVEAGEFVHAAFAYDDIDTLAHQAGSLVFEEAFDIAVHHGTGIKQQLAARGNLDRAVIPVWGVIALPAAKDCVKWGHSYSPVIWELTVT